MFEYLRGDLIALSQDSAVIETGGVGYRLKVPASSVLVLERHERGPVQLYTVCRLRDEQFVIYGFATLEERDVFARICGVAGAGPGIALAVLSGLPIEDFRTAVLSDQARVLERVKGVGKKIAQRLVLELKDVIAGEGGPIRLPTGNDTVVSLDAKAALVAIGFSAPEAEEAVRRVHREHPDAGVEEIVRRASRPAAR